MSNAVLAWLVPCLICGLAAGTVAGLAAWEDFRTLRLSNRHALVLLILFPFAAAWVPTIPFFSGLLAALLVLLPGLLLFATSIVGGGDVKLATVFALYLGVGLLGRFMLGTALTGGVLALVALAVRRFAPTLPLNVPPRHWLDLLRQRHDAARDTLPYGVALAVPFVVLLTERFAAAYHSLVQQPY